MKTLGLIGGTSWFSTVEYYKYLNRLTDQRTYGSAFPKLVLYSIDFIEYTHLVKKGDWNAIGAYFSDIARKLENAGAEGLLLCANTTHMIAEVVQENISIPLLHIVDAVAGEIEKKDIKKVALLGTSVTMENDFYQKRLLARGIETIVPDKEDRDYVNDIIFNELVDGNYYEDLKMEFLNLVDRMSGQGAGGVILGCTEIPLLLNQSDTDVPLFDSSLIHAQYAVDFAFSE